MEKYTFDEFEAASYEAWKQLAEKTLKGKPFESICAKTYEGITLKPLYTKEDVSAITIPQAAGVMPLHRDTIAQELWAKSPAVANEIVQKALAHGQNVLHLVLDGATLQGRDADEAALDVRNLAGISISSLADIETVLQGVDIQKQPLLVYTGYSAMPILALLAAQRQQAGGNASDVHGTVGADPIGYLAETGQSPFTLEQSFDAMSSTVKWTQQNMPNARTIFVRTDMYHNAGANAVQELAAALATAVEYVREGMKRGLSATEVCQQLTFSFSVGTQLFMEIAKLRAIRILWNKVAESLRAATGTIHLHTRTSRRTKTLYDHHVNLLRTTTETFSAIVGGANTIHVSTYDEAYGASTEHSERLARNIQHILQGESHLLKVLDPANGSYYIETLTEQIAQKAWELFQQLEAQGGMSEALRKGWLQIEVSQTAAKRYENVTSLKQKIIGTNIFPKKDELRVVLEQSEEQLQQRIIESKNYKENRLQASSLEDIISLENERTLDNLVRAASLGATIGEMTARFAGAGESITAFTAMRDSQPFEVLRGAAEKYAEQTGARPSAKIVKLSEEIKVAPVLALVLEACGYEVSTKEAAANLVFLHGTVDEVLAALSTGQDGASKWIAVGSYTEEEQQALKEKGASACLEKAAKVLPLLSQLQTELEVTV